MGYKTKDLVQAGLATVLILLVFTAATHVPTGFTIWPLSVMTPAQIVGAVIIGLFVFVAVPLLYYAGAVLRGRQAQASQTPLNAHIPLALNEGLLNVILIT
ncbi:hypothetical protein KC949_03965 [Candidatus Saccharibacteria bacterium]|nr:hypothetical protein [Candidatus Saccharibacteria bacterium]